MSVNVNKLLTKGKTIFLAYDQGIEHGPSDLNNKNYDPLYILDIAKKGKFNAIILQKGIAEKYKKEIKASKIPLIIKLNGKTKLNQNEPVSRQICSVQEAIKLGASAVGYTIYIGSTYEHIMLNEFSKIQEEAHKKGLAVIVWIYPRGSSVKGKPKDLMAYAARVGLEIGADIIKIKYEGKLKDLKWAVKCAGRAKLVISGGNKIMERSLIKQTKDVAASGAIGLAIGRNVWQHKNPLYISKKLKEIIFK